MQPEKAINTSASFTSTLSPYLNVKVDGYWIEIKDRSGLRGIFDTSNREVKAILINHPDTDQVRFITNAINTKTRELKL